MGPYDYTIQTPDPMQTLGQGLQMGFGIRQIQQARQAQEADAQAQAQMSADLAEASRDISKIPALMVRYPQLADKLRHANDAASAEQSRANLDHGGQVLAALQSQRPDIAAGLLRDRAAALRNSGDERGAQLTEAMAQMAETAPDILKQATALRLAAIPGGDKVIESISKLGQEQRAQELQPSVLKKNEADAEKAAVDARFAESNAVLDVQKKGWDIKKLQNDIDVAKQNVRIAAMNAQTSRINSDTQRQELALKIEEAKQKRDELIRQKVTEAETGAALIDNMLNTIARIKQNPALNDVLGPLEGSDYYPQTLVGMNMLSGTSAEDRNDAIELIKTLTSQAFLSQIPNIKGTGALSNAEGDKLQSSLTNLSRKQSEKQFKANLDEVSRLLNKARETLSKKTGVPLGKPDTPAAPGARPPLSSFGGG